MKNLAKRINIGPWINVGHKENVKVMLKNPLNLKLFIGHGKNSKIRKCSAFNKAVGPGKNPKLINVGPTSISEARVSVPGSLGAVQMLIQVDKNG